jgi:NAD(P)-dependent dehydrogenase (short-subunit alcohol dehydrogenase family)
MAFQDQMVFITGAASGIGRQLALTLAAEGARIAALDRQGPALDALAAELKGKPVACAVADVTDAAALRDAAAGLEAQLGPTDLLIASAGVGRETSATDFRAADMAEVINVNLLGVVNSIAAVLPGMRQRRCGHLAALSSLASYRGLPRMAGYCASKAGVNAVMDALRVELKPHGISVTTICPGWIQTPMTANLDVPKPHLMEAAEAARRIVRAIRRRWPFYAFPRPAARRLRLLSWLPTAASDWLLYRVVRSLGGSETPRSLARRG